MNPIIRLATESDHTEVENLTREAFWNLYFPGCDEHYLSHIIRDHRDYIKDLDYVAEIDGKLVGSIIYTQSALISENDETVEIVSFGPLCVLPQYQRKGIGTALIEKTKTRVREKGIPAIVIYGDPHNYCKHGFRNGIDFHVSDMAGNFPLGLLVLELEKGFFGDRKWNVKQSDVFTFDNDKVAEFDATFKEKEKKVTSSQALFSMLIRAYLRNS